MTRLMDGTPSDMAVLLSNRGALNASRHPSVARGTTARHMGRFTQSREPPATGTPTAATALADPLRDVHRRAAICWSGSASCFGRCSLELLLNRHSPDEGTI